MSAVGIVAALFVPEWSDMLREELRALAFSVPVAVVSGKILVNRLRLAREVLSVDGEFKR